MRSFIFSCSLRVFCHFIHIAIITINIYLTTTHKSCNTTMNHKSPRRQNLTGCMSSRTIGLPPFDSFLFSSLLLSASPSFHEAISLFHTIPSIRTTFSPLHLSNTLLPHSLLCRLLFLCHHSSQLLHQPFPHEKPRPSTLAALPPPAGLGCNRHWFRTPKYMTYRLALFCTLNFLAQTSLMDYVFRSCACIVKHSVHLDNVISGSF